MSYRIGEGPRRSSSQPTLFFSFLRSVEKQHLSEISTFRKTNKHRTW